MTRYSRPNDRKPVYTSGINILENVLSSTFLSNRISTTGKIMYSIDAIN